MRIVIPEFNNRSHKNADWSIGLPLSQDFQHPCDRSQRRLRPLYFKHESGSFGICPANPAAGMIKLLLSYASQRQGLFQQLEQLVKTSGR